MVVLGIMVMLGSMLFFIGVVISLAWLLYDFVGNSDSESLFWICGILIVIGLILILSESKNNKKIICDNCKNEIVVEENNE